MTASPDDNVRDDVEITLRKPDFDVGFKGELTVSSTVAVLGAKIALSAVVANRGGDAAAVPVKLYIDKSINPVVRPTVTTTTGIIPVDGTETVQIVWDTAGLQKHGRIRADAASGTAGRRQRGRRRPFDHGRIVPVRI